MSALPTVRGGAQALYPVTRRINFQTLVSISANGSEQRSTRCGVPYFQFALEYQNLSLADVATMTTFFANQGGMFSSGWQFTLGTQTYLNLAFDQDVLEFSEPKPNLYACALQFHQTQNKSYTIPAALSAFPTLANGTITELPYGSLSRSMTIAGDSPMALRYSFKLYGASLTNFPTRPLKKWKLSYSALPDADVATIEAAFVGWQGKFAGFSFTDPDTGTVYPNCRLDQDILELKYLGINQTSTQLVIVETNG